VLSTQVPWTPLITSTFIWSCKRRIW
jgi:hypothetical protein